jgi:anti-sigma B factor antagonist
MALPSQCRGVDVEQVGSATVVRFPRSIILEGDDAERVGEYLLGLVVDAGRCRLVLNCQHLESLSSAMLGKLITIHKKALALGGRLALCRIAPPLQQVFDTLKLSVLIGIYDDEAAAVRSFQE